MGIKELKEERRYRAYLKWMERAEFIETKEVKNTTEDKVEIHTTNPVLRGIIPKHCGTKIDIYI